MNNLYQTIGITLPLTFSVIFIVCGLGSLFVSTSIQNDNRIFSEIFLSGTESECEVLPTIIRLVIAISLCFKDSTYVILTCIVSLGISIYLIYQTISLKAFSSRKSIYLYRLFCESIFFTGSIIVIIVDIFHLDIGV